jgi:energy-coupling factor transporter ATP-binding protein EcfA2
MKMLKSIDYNSPSSTGLMLLIYGPPGSGKSSIVGSVAAACEASGDDRRAIIGDTELGASAALRRAGCQRSALLDLTVAGGSSSARSLSGHVLNDENCGLFVLDTLTELAVTVLRDAMGDRDMPEMRDYGKRKVGVMQIIRGARDVAASGRPVIITAQQGTHEVEGLANVFVPEVPKNDRQDLVSQMDAVARLRIAQTNDAEGLGLQPGDRYLDFRTDRKHLTKMRDPDPFLAHGLTDAGIWPLVNTDSTTRLFAALAQVKGAKK